MRLTTRLRLSPKSCFCPSLRLPEGLGDVHPEDGVIATRVIPDLRLPFGLWTFDLGYTRLLRFLSGTFDVNADPERGPCNLIVFPYDWRLSNRYNGARLREVAERALGRWREQAEAYAQAKLVFIAHSMGGLVARWYVDALGGAEVTNKLITLGTPHRGALEALQTLAYGVQKEPARLCDALTQLGQSLPSLHQLLPEYACIEQAGSLLKLSELPDADIPTPSVRMLRDATQFHDQLANARATRKHDYTLHPIGGYAQPTLTTARVQDARLLSLHEIAGHDEGGDGTVPRLSFAPKDISPAHPGNHYATDNHSGLVHNRAVFDQIEGILTARDIVHRAAPVRLSVEVPEILSAGEPLTLKARLVQGDRPVEALVSDAHATPLGKPVRMLDRGDGVLQANQTTTGRLPHYDPRCRSKRCAGQPDRHAGHGLTLRV